MPVNRNALIRYRTLDNCLRNRYRRWTLDDLIEACSEALYEYEGIDKGVSKRTVQMDLQVMRSDKLGYNAPIVVKEKKYYTYEDPDYSITNIPLTDHDLGKLTEVVDILRQFKGFTHFQELSGMVQRLEDKIHTSKTQQAPIIDLEKNENLKGLEYLDVIYQAILDKKVLDVHYKSFKARQVNSFKFHAALLKEYRNRWFVLGKKSARLPFMLLALDRIQALDILTDPSLEFDEQQVGNYFKHVVGVSVNEGEASKEVLLQVDHSSAPYILTKPLHQSQTLVDKTDYGIIIKLTVQPNFELEREILGFGDTIKVIAPERLKSRIREKFMHALDLYETEIGEKRLQHIPKRLQQKGSLVFNNLYTKREVSKMGKLIINYLKQTASTDQIAIRNLLEVIPDLKGLVFNRSLKRILQTYSNDLFLIKAIYFNKPAAANWSVNWHQDLVINVAGKTSAKGYKAWTQKGQGYGVIPPLDVRKSCLSVRIHLDHTNRNNGALKVVSGSHQKMLSDTEISLISENCIPQHIEVRAGGVHLMHPLLLHASEKSLQPKARRVLHLEFSTAHLPKPLVWSEYQTVF